MEKQNTTNSNLLGFQPNTSSALQQKSQQTAVSLSERYREVTTIAQAFQLQEAPLANLKGDVKGSIKLHLAALARFLNLRSTLTDEHIDFIADKMLSDQYYKWLKPADLKIFFDRIKMGHYGDFYGNLNSISFFQSLDKYMIERNGEIESLRMQEAIKQREEIRQTKVLNYFINKEGKIEYTDAKKAQIAEEERRKTEINAETKRKQNAHACWLTDDEKNRVEQIMDEWDIPYPDALRLMRKEKSGGKDEPDEQQNTDNND